MNREFLCMRCNKPMRYLGDKDLFDELTSKIALYDCIRCGKIEFFRSEEFLEDLVKRKECPECANQHDADFPICPFCEYEYKTN